MKSGLTKRVVGAKWLVVGALLVVSFSGVAMEAGISSDSAGELNAPGYLARIEKNTPEDLLQALERAESLFLDGRIMGDLPPAAIVVHGPEVEVFFRNEYPQNKMLVDLAARLSAFKVIDIFVCETRMGVMGRNKSELLPFVGTVPFGPAEEERLLNQEGYVHF